MSKTPSVSRQMQAIIQAVIEDTVNVGLQRAAEYKSPNLTALVSAIAALEHRVETLEAENKRLSKPDYFFDANGWEYTMHNKEDCVEELSVGRWTEVGRLASLPSIFAARIPTVVNEDGDVEDDEVMWFKSQAEAEAAIAECKADPSSPPVQTKGDQ